MGTGDWRRPAMVGVALVFALLGTVVAVALAGGDEGSDDEARDDPASSTTEAPRVLGDEAERPSSTTTTTGSTTTTTTAAPRTPAPAVTTTVPPPATPAPRPSPPPPGAAPAPVEPAAPTTTTCRNATDPACGELIWDPQPARDGVRVEVFAAPERATVGEEVTFAVGYVDPAGPAAYGACTRTEASDGAPQLEDCGPVENLRCPRHGPHDPPAPADEAIPVGRTFRFADPGEHTVTFAGTTASHLGDGCASPYRQPWSRTFTIVVEPEGAG